MFSCAANTNPATRSMIYSFVLRSSRHCGVDGSSTPSSKVAIKVIAAARATTRTRRYYHHLLSDTSTGAATTTTLFHRSSGLLQTTKHHQKRSIFIQTSETPNPESVKFYPTGRMVLANESNNVKENDKDENKDSNNNNKSDDGEIDIFANGGKPLSEVGVEDVFDDDDDDEVEDNIQGYYVTKKDPKESVLRSPLAMELFRIDGVKAVYLGADFVTVTKYAEQPWMLLRPQVFDAMMNFFGEHNERRPALLDRPEITDTTILDDDDEVVAMIKELIETRIRPAVQEDGGDIRYVSFDEETGLVTVRLAGSCVGCPSSSVTLKQGVENMLMHYISEVTSVVAEEEEEDDGTGAPTREDLENVFVDDSTKTQKTYEERLKAAGIPFSD